MSKSTFRASSNQQGLMENMQILTGQKGDRLDKALTLREAASLGMVNLRRNSSGQIVPELPPSHATDPEWTGVQMPHAPVNVTADGAFHTITLTWDAPTYRGHGFAEVLRAEVNNPAQAVRIGTTLANVYSDAVGKGFSAYYWVRFVNKNSMAGPLHSTAGLRASTSPDVDEIIASATNFAIYNPAKPSEKEIVFGVTDDGKVAIREAVIKAATIQIIHSEKITADYIKAGVSISAPSIVGGSFDMGNAFMSGGSAGFGLGGPYSAWGKGWNTVIYSDGSVYTNRLRAEGGYVKNMSIGNCTIEQDCVVKGIIYADRIVGGVITERDFITSDYLKPTNGAWVTVLGFRIIRASNMTRRLRISGTSVSVSVTAPPGGTMSYTAKLRVLYGGNVSVEREINATATSNTPGAAYANETLRISELIAIGSASTGDVQVQVYFPYFNAGGGGSSAIYHGGEVTCRLFIDSEEMIQL